MSPARNNPHRVAPFHGLIIIALAAILLDVFRSAADLGFPFSSGSDVGRGECVYQVFQGSVCQGTLFLDEQAELRTILDLLGINQRTGSALAERKIRCNCALKLGGGPLEDREERISVRQLVCAGKRIDVNVADADDLTGVPGIGTRLSERIVAYRKQFGPFQTTQDLRTVPGIGKKKLAAIEPYLKAKSAAGHSKDSGRQARSLSP